MAGQVWGTDSVRVRVESLEPRQLFSGGAADLDFGTAGRVVTRVGESSFLNDLTTTPTGHIVATGKAFSGGRSVLVAAKYLPDGSLDPTFGVGGVATFAPGPGQINLQGAEVVVRPDGKVLIAGEAVVPVDARPGGALSAYVPFLARLEADGSPDVTFDQDGFWYGAVDDYALAYVADLRLEPDGSVLLANNDHKNNGWELWRFGPDGSPDPTFGVGGRVVQAVDGVQGRATGILVKADGAIVVSGSTNIESRPSSILAQYAPDGSPDLAFGTDGLIYNSVLNSYGFGVAALRTDDTMLVPGNNKILRYAPDGTLLGTVSTGAIDPINIAVLADGHVMYAGYHYGDFGLARLRPDLTRDTDFGTNGLATTNFNDATPEQDAPMAIAVREDGTVIVGGYTGDFASSFALASYTNDLTPPVVDPSVDPLPATEEPPPEPVADPDAGTPEQASLRTARSLAASGAAAAAAATTGQSRRFTVVRSGPTALPLVVRYTLGGTAANGVDYQRLPGYVVIPANKTSADVLVVPVADGLGEGDESVVLTLAGSGAYPIYLRGGAGKATMTIGETAAAPARLAGRVFNDADGNGVQSAGEPGLAGRVVFLDDNANGAFDVGEPSQTTTADGRYGWRGLAAGTRRVGVLPPGSVAGKPPASSAGFVATSPANGSGLATLAPGQVLAGFNFGFRQPPAVPTQTVTARAAADAYVRDGGYAGTNYGSAATFDVAKSAASGGQRQSYIRFNLSSFASSSLIQSAKVRLYAKSSTGAGVPVGLFVVSNNAWTETGLKWSNKPAPAATPVWTKSISGTAGAWYEADVTTYLKQQRAAGAAAVNFAIVGTSASSAVAQFASDEASANRPELRVVQQVVTTTTLRATADASVRDGTYGSQNFGSAGTLMIRKSTAAGSSAWSLLQFDLTSVPTVALATLRLYGQSSAAAGSVTVQAFAASAVAWTEAGVKWSNKPSTSGSSLGQISVSGTAGRWYTIDLTGWLKSQKAAGKKSASLVLASPVTTSAAATFASDESGGNRPQLVVKG